MFLHKNEHSSNKFPSCLDTNTVDIFCLWFFYIRTMPIGQETVRLQGRVTLGLTALRLKTSDPLPMIPHQVETQFITSQPFPVSVSGLNSFTIRCPSPMLVWKMPAPSHRDSDSSRISTPTRLPDTYNTRPGTDLTSELTNNSLLKIKYVSLDLPSFIYSYPEKLQHLALKYSL